MQTCNLKPLPKSDYLPGEKAVQLETLVIIFSEFFFWIAHNYVLQKYLFGRLLWCKKKMSTSCDFLFCDFPLSVSVQYFK